MRRERGFTDLAIAVLALSAGLLVAGCGESDAGGDLQVGEVRSCMEKRAKQVDGISVVVGKMETENSFGIQMQDLSGGSPETAAVFVTVSDDGEFLDQWQENQESEAGVKVDRIQNVVVVYYDDFDGDLAAGQRLVESCL